MQNREMDDNQKEIVSKIIEHVNTVMGFLDLYEPNRPASIAVTKLEEAVMWSQVMVANCKLKEETLAKVAAQKAEPLEGEIITAHDVDTEK